MSFKVRNITSLQTPEPSKMPILPGACRWLMDAGVLKDVDVFGS